MNDLIQYRVWIDSKTNSVRLEATGFENAEDAMAFANWLSELPLEDADDDTVH